MPQIPWQALSHLPYGLVSDCQISTGEVSPRRGHCCSIPTQFLPWRCGFSKCITRHSCILLLSHWSHHSCAQLDQRGGGRGALTLSQSCVSSCPGQVQVTHRALGHHRARTSLREVRVTHRDHIRVSGIKLRTAHQSHESKFISQAFIDAS